MLSEVGTEETFSFRKEGKKSCSHISLTFCHLKHTRVRKPQGEVGNHRVALQFLMLKDTHTHTHTHPYVDYCLNYLRSFITKKSFLSLFSED